MARYNPELMRIDDGQEQPRRVFGPRTDTSQITEQQIYEASRDAAIELEVDPVQLAYEAGLAGDTSKPMNKMTAAERTAFAKGRTAKQAEARETTQAGDNPDNPMPSEDPGPGMYWANYGGVWRKYKYVTNDTSSNNNGNNNNGGGNNNNGNNGGGNDASANATKYAADLQAASDAAAVKSQRLSAWAVLKAEFDKYGLGTLADAVKEMIINGTPSAQATMILRERPEYKARFAGNEARRTAGLNVYDEGTYLDLENTMAEIFTAYGQKSLMGSTREQQQATFAKYIGATIAPTELKRRMDIATGLSKSDNNTLKAIKQLYPMIGDNDIVAYFLNPQETLPKLETKAQAASIGGAFLQQGLKINSASMEEYAALGVSREQAQLGAAQIAGVLPRAAQLRSYENGTYTQEQAEDVYLRQSATAKKELEDINKREIARLSGSAGTSKVSLKSAARNTF
jgi:hypothetical protein